MAWYHFNKKEEVIDSRAEDYAAENERFSAYSYNPIFTLSFDGEKTPGEIGIIKNYDLDYSALRARSWQSYIESDVTQTVVNRFITWIIGSGLKLQSEPIELLLQENNINIDSNSFSKSIEARFQLFAKTSLCDYSKTKNLNQIAYEAKKQALLGGDVLVILRIENKKLNIQLVEGQDVSNPYYTDEKFKKDLKKGYKVQNGIVTNKKGEQVAFYISDDSGGHVRVSAKTSNGYFEQAFLVNGLKYRLRNNRGIPLISTSLETLKKLDRYKEAAVATAEEVAKIAYAIEHGNNSTGENPLQQNLKASLGLDNEKLNKDDGSQTANKIAATTQKQVFNMPVDSTLKTLDSKNNLHFKEFYSVNIDMVCAALGIPPEVALSKYDSNYSASRAALKDWEHSLNVSREDFSVQFYNKVFKFWLGNEILNNRVKAPGYLKALLSDNVEVLESYYNARFIGSTVPHIDPLKEVQAERAKLGPLGANVPLTTVEAATEALNGGDSEANSIQFLTEVEKFKIEPKTEQKTDKKEEKE